MRLRMQYGVRFTNWGLSLRQLDPRMQILTFFNQIAAVGANKRLERCKIHTTGVCTGDCLDQRTNLKPSVPRSKKFSLFHPHAEIHPNTSLSANQFHLVSNCFDQASVFTVWRPTSQEAIRKMMRGDAVGKGLDIKGKSAKRGKLSALVPVVQIHNEKHKLVLRHIPKDATMRLYFSSSKAREVARERLQHVLHLMDSGYKEAALVVRKQETLEKMLGNKTPSVAEDIWEKALDRYYRWELADDTIRNLDDLAVVNRFGLELSQRLFVEAYIHRANIIRTPGSPDDTGRPSIAAFQDMNLETLRKQVKRPSIQRSASSRIKKTINPSLHKIKGNEDTQDWTKHHTVKLPPRPVAFQMATDPMNAMEARDLVMAYEEEGRVLPVVSDFDCFLSGTRRVNYKKAIPTEQVEMMNWCVDKIEQVLDDCKANSNEHPSTERENPSWTGKWLDVLTKERIETDFKPDIPKYGYADPKSYAIIGHAIDHLGANGCVRHGAECFNYYFPQELDERFLVVSNDIKNGGNRWAFFGQKELLKYLSEKVESGFMFPLNPTWILCYPEWKKLYDKQLHSTNLAVKQSVKAWYPPSSGIRDRIESVHAKHPRGFPRKGQGAGEYGEEDMAMSLMALDRAEKLHTAKKAFHSVLAVTRMKKLCQAAAGAAAELAAEHPLNIRTVVLGRGSFVFEE